jgi:hypothetical protein
MLLPLFSLTLFVALVALPATFTYLDLQQSPPDLSRQETQQHSSLKETLRSVAASEPESFADFLNGIDVPANFVELPIDRFSNAWPDTWHPDGLTVFDWRAITFPIYTLPFWWFAGFGLDTLLKRRRPRWPVLLVGTILSALSLFLTIGMSLANGIETDRAITVPILIGGILWNLLFATFPVAWILRGLARRALAKQRARLPLVASE